MSFVLKLFSLVTTTCTVSFVAKHSIRRSGAFDVILLFLSKFHGIEMRTLKNRYKSALGLHCRSAHFDDTEVRASVQQALQASLCQPRSKLLLVYRRQ